MKKKIISKALCVALASVLMFGEAAPAMAATKSLDQGQAVVAEDTFSASIDGIEAGNSATVTDDHVGISAWGSGTSAKLYVNGVEFASRKTSYGYWDINADFYGKAGVTYTFKIEAEGSDGSTVTKTFNRKFETPVLDKSTTRGWWNSEIDETGYSKYTSLYVNTEFLSRVSAKYDYYVYRSTNPKTGFKKISSNTVYGGTNCYNYDYNAAYGRTYYYQIKVVAEKDDYIKTTKVIATSPVIKVSADNWKNIYVNAELDHKGVKLNIEDRGIYNQFDIYRSASKNGGYKKIKTITGDEFTDTTVKAGKIYYYKVIPKYYETKTGKLVSGNTTAAVGVKVTMGTPVPIAQITSSTSVKLTWDKGRGANVYEIWYMQTDISGNQYSKLGVTKGNSYTVKGLKNGHLYRFMLKAQNVSNGKVVCENQNDTGRVIMGYDDNIYSLRATYISTAISKDKKTLAIYTNLAWDKNYWASGYVITAYNRYTGKEENVAKISSGTKNTYRFKNPGTSTKGMKYTYVRVRPYKGSVVSDTPIEINVNCMPFAPGVKVSRKTNSSAVISWKAVPGASGYSVYRTNKQSGETQWRGNVTATKYEDKDYSVKTDYEYYVVAQSSFEGAWGNSHYIYEGNAKYFAKYQHKLAAPKMGSAKNTAAGQVKVKWYAVAGAQRYWVYRSTSKNGKYTKIASVATTSYVDKKAAKGGTYYYKVAAAAVSGAGVKAQSAYSAVAGAKSSK